MLWGKLTNDPTKTRKVDEDIAFAAEVKKIQDKKNQSIYHILRKNTIIK